MCYFPESVNRFKIAANNDIVIAVSFPYVVLCPFLLTAELFAAKIANRATG